MHSGIWIVILLMVGWACETASSKRLESGKAKFSTSDASEIYFRNVRQIAYEKTTLEEAKLDIYRFEKRNTSEEAAVLNLAIAINWRFDEAYLQVEPNRYLQQMDTLEILWQDTTSKQEGTYLFKGGNKEDHFSFVLQTYRHIRQEQKLYLMKSDGMREPLLEDRRSREAFRITAYDYFRLVDLL
jgi:hypothetical protein